MKGELEEALPFAEFCKTISSALNLSSGELRATVPRKVQPERLMIKNVGLCTGAGCDMAELAAANGCDAFVTGDMKYHVAQRFCEKGICVIDAGHYGTEKFFSENMARLLQTRTDGKIEIIVSKMDINPFLFF